MNFKEMANLSCLNFKNDGVCHFRKTNNDIINMLELSYVRQIIINYKICFH